MLRITSTLALAALLLVARPAAADEPGVWPARFVPRIAVGGYATVVADTMAPLGPQVQLGLTLRVWRYVSLDLEGAIIFGPHGSDAGGIPESIDVRAGVEAATRIRATKFWLLGRLTAGLLEYIDAGTDGSERYSLSGRAFTGRMAWGVRYAAAQHAAIGLELAVTGGALNHHFSYQAQGDSSDGPYVALDLALVGYLPLP